ncbi:MAG: tetratricopeptide repeat protein [Flavobacteriales bacterium]
MRTALVLLLGLALHRSGAQHLTHAEWARLALTDVRLLPRYGDREKTPAQQASDREFLAALRAVDSLPRSASDRLVAHGFHYLKEGDLTKAMHRFNQAWLADSSNAAAYWGFGAFFLELDQPAMARLWLKRGLNRDSTRYELLDLCAAALVGEAHLLGPGSAADGLVAEAAVLLERAIRLAPERSGAVCRLAAVRLARKECADARRLDADCNALGGTRLGQRIDAACPP